MSTTDVAATRSTAPLWAGRELVWFWSLSYALSWLIWIPLVENPALAAAESPWRPLYHAGFLGPMLAALIVTARFEGVHGLGALRDGFSVSGRRAWWVVLGAALPFVIWRAAVEISHWWLGTGVPPAYLLGAWIDLPGVSAVLGWVFIVATIGVGAEVGWRGFALPRLQSGMHPLAATALLTAAWAGWHLPLFRFDPIYRSLGAAETVLWLVALLAGGVVLAWLYDRSRGSTLACALMHGALVSIGTSWAVADPIDSVMIAIVIVLGLVLAWPLSTARPVRWPERGAHRGTPDGVRERRAEIRAVFRRA